MSESPRVVQQLVIVAIAAAAIAIGFVLFTSTGRDDNYITYWSAHSLVEHGEITNINGDHLEQSSSLLFTIAVALVSRVTTLSIPTAGMVLGILFGFLAIVVGARLVGRIDRRLQISLALVIATSPALLYWAFGGMETTMTAVLLIWAADSAMGLLDEKSPRTTPLLSLVASFLLFTMVRPEGGMVLIASAVGIAIVVVLDGRGRDAGVLRRVLVMFGVAVCATGLVMGFRRLYFGSYFPQPVLAKSSGFTLDRAADGFGYLWSSRGSLWALIPACVGAGRLVRDLIRRDRFSIITIPTAMLFVYLACIVATGGDWMELGRFIAPMTPLLALCALDTCCRIPWRRALVAATAILVLSNVVGLVQAVRGESCGIPIWSWRDVTCADCAEAPWYERYNHIHNRDLKYLVPVRKLVTSIQSLLPGRPIVVLSPNAGLVAYYLRLEFSNDFYLVDACGLVTDHMNTCPITRDVKKAARGMCPTIQSLLEERTQLRDQCGIYPDVILAFFRGTPAGRADLDHMFAGVGYRVMLAEGYPASADGVITTPDNMNQFEYVAVRDDIAARLTTVER